MNRGKAKCDKLKDIRRQIAKANNIEYNPSECTFEGDCDGTCPKCDSELEHLNQAVAQKEANGEKVIIPSIGMDEDGSVECDNEPMDPDDIVLAGMPTPLMGESMVFDPDELPTGGDVVYEDEEIDPEERYRRLMSDLTIEEGLLYNPETGQFERRKLSQLNGLIDDDLKDNESGKPLGDSDSHTGFA